MKLFVCVPSAGTSTAALAGDADAHDLTRVFAYLYTQEFTKLVQEYVEVNTSITFSSFFAH
ncbi:hypothetical protein [Rhodanobacter denitrificans]|uniref:hypothetical protein n=1 Tax=Rhodanobacter denitrificans TaxID=666685 RepID=UPI0011C07B7A|nr:hypothetical protein [Rhodanobacter denitrificans]